MGRLKDGFNWVKGHLELLKKKARNKEDLMAIDYILKDCIDPEIEFFGQDKQPDGESDGEDKN